LKKLIVIPGDTTIEELALSIADKKRLTNKVSVVFHMAANVRFDLSLKTAVKMNTMSTINVVTLIKQVRTRYTDQERRVMQKISVIPMACALFDFYIIIKINKK